LAKIMELKNYLPNKYHRKVDKSKSPGREGFTVAFEHEDSPERKPIATTSMQISGPGNKFTKANQVISNVAK
jgi:hypothetical protein